MNQADMDDFVQHHRTWKTCSRCGDKARYNRIVRDYPIGWAAIDEGFSDRFTIDNKPIAVVGYVCSGCIDDMAAYILYPDFADMTEELSNDQ